MNDNILPSYDKTIYETHFWVRKQLPFIFHRDTLREDGSQFTPSLHVNLEFLYCLEGSGQIIYDGTPMDVRPGDLVVLNSYIPHTIITSNCIRTDCLIIDNGFLEQIGIDLSVLQFVPIIHNRTVSRLWDDLSREFLCALPFRNAALHSAVLRLLLYLCRNYSTEKQSHAYKSGVMERVWSSIEYMKEHISQKLSLERLAATTGFSKYYFLRVFKEYTGYTPNTYLALLRCDLAKRMLKSGEYSVRDVAEACGFESLSYFSKVFKTHTGQLPAAVLKGIPLQDKHP